jgi:hypothetical protein
MSQGDPQACAQAGGHQRQGDSSRDESSVNGTRLGARARPGGG